MRKERKKIFEIKTVQDGQHVDVFLIFVFILIMVLLSVGSLLLPDREMSENENRYLTQAPKLSTGDILSGKFETQLEDYLSDQIIGRENWIKIMAGTLKDLRFKDVNGVYLMDGGRLAERLTQADFKIDRYIKNLKEIKTLREELDDAAINVLLVPSAAYSYREEFNMSTNFNEKEALDTARAELGDMYIELDDKLMPETTADGRKDYYFLTDHHWNYNGAETAAREFRNRIGLEDRTWEPEELTRDFMGTLYSKVLLNERTRDVISVPEDSLDARVKVTIEGEDHDPIYFMDRLEQKDKYEVFLGGNYDRVDIVNEDDPSKDKPTLLIVKDSYANSFVPFIINDFSKITLVDTRYYKQSVLDTAEDEGFDQVLILYSISNFSEEKMMLTETMLQ